MIGYNQSGLAFLPEFNKMSNVLSVVPIVIAVYLIKRSYAVDMQTGHPTRWKPDSPAAAWYFFLFHKKFTTWIFCEKDPVSSALPDAEMPFGFVTA
jgi:hypothetical protein